METLGLDTVSIETEKGVIGTLAPSMETTDGLDRASPISREERRKTKHSRALDADQETDCNSRTRSRHGKAGSTKRRSQAEGSPFR